jgi:hypothetical protein
MLSTRRECNRVRTLPTHTVGNFAHRVPYHHRPEVWSRYLKSTSLKFTALDAMGKRGMGGRGCNQVPWIFQARRLIRCSNCQVEQSGVGLTGRCPTACTVYAHLPMAAVTLLKRGFPKSQDQHEHRFTSTRAVPLWGCKARIYALLRQEQPSP